MKKTILFAIALACGMAFTSCNGKKDVKALSGSINEATEELTETTDETAETEVLQLTEDIDSTTIAIGTAMSGFRCTCCSCPSYTGVYKGYYPSCTCGHAYGVHR